MKIHIIADPPATQVIQLLQECELPVSDLCEHSFENFLALGNEARLDGVIGLEIYGEDGLLRSLAVASDVRHRGLGKQLVRALEHHAQAQQLKRLYLLTETAALFFSKLGFETVARALAPAAIKSTQEFSTLCPDDAVLMRKVLR